MKKFTQSRNYCFTIFRETDFEKFCANVKKYEDIVRYFCIGYEVCPTTGTPHLQGWIQFFNKKRIGGVKKILGCSAHIEPCKGDEFSNEKYCKKDGKFICWGKFITQGYRSDLEQIKKDIKKGKSKEEIIDNHFETYCRYRNGINDYFEIQQKKQRSEFRKVHVDVYSGSTGTGKTRRAMEEPNSYKITGDNLKWFDGYAGEKTLIIDEYDNNVPVSKLLNLLDGYKLRLDIKGSFTYANWEKVIITTNLEKDQFHANAKEKHREALFRRVSNWVDFDKCRFGTGNTRDGTKLCLKTHAQCFAHRYTASPPRGETITCFPLSPPSVGEGGMRGNAVNIKKNKSVKCTL